jgi:2,3-bisphosphoglycerate-independent phosphoglycerate mutase
MRGDGRTVALVVLDGAAGRPAPELDGRTPLEAAATPNLDRLAETGISGTMDVRRPGTPLSSDRAHTLLFGYALGEVPGRGVLEARGFDVGVEDGSVACSASFARIEESGAGWTITNRTLREARDACPDAAERVDRFETPDATVRFHYTWKNRGIVTLDPNGSALSPEITDADPFESGLPVVAPEPLADATDPDAARRTADALAAYTRWSADRLAETTSDIVLSKWAGTPTDPPAFATRHGTTARTLTPKPVLQGLGETLELSVDGTDGSYDERVERALAAIDAAAFVHLHFPEPDEVAHAEPPSAKRDELETIDAALEPLADRALADPDLVLAVTADHTTPSRGNVVHSGEPVPLTVTGETIRTDSVATAGERHATAGGLGRIRGRDLMRLLRSSADRVLLDGLRRTPDAPDHPTTDLAPLEREP